MLKIFNATAADNETREKMIFASHSLSLSLLDGEGRMFTRSFFRVRKRKKKSERRKKGEMKSRITPSG